MQRRAEDNESTGANRPDRPSQELLSSFPKLENGDAEIYCLSLSQPVNLVKVFYIVVFKHLNYSLSMEKT